MQTADAALVRACQAGDRAPFCRLVERHYGLACAVAFAATGSLEASRDVAQEAFVTAWRELPKLREPARFRAWLCGIVRNTARYQRRHDRRHAPEARESLAALQVAAQGPTAHDALEHRERLRLVEDALARLPGRYREPLVLFYWDEQSIEQVAAQLELSSATVRQRLCRGRRQLARQVRGLAVEDVLGAVRPRRDGVAVAVIAAIVAAEREAAAAAAVTAGGWAGAGLVEALVGVAALTAVLIASALDVPKPLPPPAIASTVDGAAAAADVIASAEAPAAQRWVPVADEEARELAPSPTKARRAVLRTRPRGVVAHGRIEVQRAPDLQRAAPRAPIELPLIEAVGVVPARVVPRVELAPPALDLMRDFDDL